MRSPGCCLDLLKRLVSKTWPSIPLLLIGVAVSTLLPSESFAQDSDSADRNITLPTNDDHYKATRRYVEDVPIAGYQHAPPASFEAFRDLKYGVRIHWGIYSILEKPGESWPYLKMSYADKEAYNNLYKTWNPTGFDAEEWMRIFRDSGMKMFAFTTKHHEGFSMFDTKTRVTRRVNWTAPGGPVFEDCDLAYSIMETPFHRDVVKELCDAGHKYGLAIDLYFSNPDWYDADFRPYVSHPVVVADPPDATRGSLDKKGQKFENAPPVTAEEEARMMARYRAQLTELLTNYGKIDMICLDMWLGKKVWPQMRETLLALRKIQPAVMFRARGIGNYGDYYTPERFVPGGKENTGMPWFVIYPLARSFSFDANPSEYKNGQWIVRSLVDTVAKGGNFMVAIGPDKNGRFSPAALESLKTAGDWLKVNGEGIYATRPREGALWKEGDEIRYTRTKDHRTVYAFVLHEPGNTLVLKTVRPRAGSEVHLLGFPDVLSWTYVPGTGTVVQMPEKWPELSKQKDFFVSCIKLLVGA